MFLKSLSIVSMVFAFSACVSGGQDDVLQSAIQPSQSLEYVDNTSDYVDNSALTGNISKPESTVSPQDNVAFASEQPPLNPLLDEEILPPPPPRFKKTYLINGLASSVEAIGYGFTNLSKKIPDSHLYNYASFVESSTIIRSNVTKEIIRAYKENPALEINLIGISFGANIVTWIAQDLNRKNVPVNYLATLEGPAMAPIYKNVRLADNFSCTGLNCFRTTSRLSWGNNTTEFEKFKVNAGHVGLADHHIVHNRVISQINRPTTNIEEQQFVAQ